MIHSVRKRFYGYAISRMILFRRIQAALIWYLLSLIPITHLLDLQERDVFLFSSGVILLAMVHWRRIHWRNVAAKYE